MVGRLASKVAVVTGGSTGIGQAVARRVVSESASAVIGGQLKDAGERAATEIRNDGGRALFAATDGTVERDVERQIRLAVAEFGRRLDGTVDNAGGGHAAGPVHAIDSSLVPRW